MKSSDHYDKKYLKKNRGHTSRSPRLQLGNSRSLAKSRPSGWALCQSRLGEKNILFDTQQHKTIDHHPIKHPFMYRKSSIQTIVSYQERRKINRSTDSVYNKNISLGKKAVEITLPKLLYLPAIHPNLYIGNRQAAEDNKILCNYRIHLIINLSGKSLITYSNNIPIYNLEYNDTRALTYHNWKAIVDQVLKIMDDNTYMIDKHHFLIVCEKAVNRSVSIAIAYAIIKKKNDI